MADEQQPHPEEPPAEGDAPAPPDPRSGGETAEFPRPAADETAVLPPATEPPPAPATWSARAGVPVGGPRQPAPEPQWVPDQEPRTWWAPIVIGVAILVLIGLIGLGLWIATRNPATPAPSASPSPTPSSPSPSPSPSRTASASPTPTVVLVPVPSLRGVSLTDAQQILQSQGLNWKVVTRPSTEFPAGTVIDTDPPATTPVPAGTEVTLFVATAPPPSPSPSSPSPSPET